MGGTLAKSEMTDDKGRGPRRRCSGRGSPRGPGSPGGASAAALEGDRGRKMGVEIVVLFAYVFAFIVQIPAFRCFLSLLNSQNQSIGHLTNDI